MRAKLEKYLTKMLEVICINLLVGLALAVIYATTLRYLGASPSWYDEIASVLLAWLTWFGAAYALFLRQHMRFGGLITALPARAALFLALCSELLVIGFFAVVAWYGYDVLSVARWDSLLSIRWITLDIVQSVIPLTAAVMIVATVLTLPQTLKMAVAGLDTDHADIEHAIAEALHKNKSLTAEENLK